MELSVLKAHEGLSALVYPATPDSIRLSEAYEGAPPPSTSQGRGLWSAWRHAFRLRWIFRVFTVVSLFVLCMAVLISMQAAIGYALLRDAKVAIKEARALRVQNATTLPRSALDESGQTTRQKEADTTALMTSDRLRDWITSPVVYLLTGRRIPEFHVEEGRMADPTLPTAAEADLTLMTTILLPILGGFLGAYCEFVRWFTRRQLAMMMTSGDGMQIAVRFMLALVVTVIVAMISQAIPLGQLTSFLPFIFAFIVGYLASHLFSALDTLITAPSSIVLAQRVERATRNVIEQTQATQITAFKGSVEEVIGRTLGVPNVGTSSPA